MSVQRAWWNCCSSRPIIEKEGEDPVVSVSFADPQLKGNEGWPLMLKKEVNTLLNERQNQTFQLTLNMPKHLAISNENPQAWLAGKVHEYMHTFLEDNKEVCKSKSIARVVVKLADTNYYAFFIALTDRSRNPLKLLAAVLVMDQCFYMTKQKNKMSVFKEDYLMRLLQGEPCGSLFEQSDRKMAEGAQKQRIGCFSKVSSVSIYDTGPSIEGVPEEILNYDMDIADERQIQIEKRPSRQSGIFVLDLLGDDNKDGEFVLERRGNQQGEGEEGEENV